MGRIVAFEKKLQVPLDIVDPDARDRANELMTSGKRDVLVRVEAGQRQQDDATDYRHAPTSERILRGLQVEQKPTLPGLSGGDIANWLVRGAIVAGLAVGWWAVAGQPLAEALGLLD
jgi:hypothetical protein